MSSAEIFHHKKKIEEIEQEFLSFANDLDKLYGSKEQRIREWAQHLEALILAGELNLQIDEISTYIRNRLRELHVPIHEDYVPKCLDKKYKKAIRAENALKNPYLSEQRSAETILEKPVSVMTDDEVRKAIELAPELKAEYARRKQAITEKEEALIAEAHRRGIAAVAIRKTPISTPKDPRVSKSYQALRELAQIIGEPKEDHEKTTGLIRKLYDFPPEGKDDEALAKVIGELIVFLKPLQDEKFSKSFIAWLKIMQDYVSAGKHAAGSMNATITIYGDERKLTREQVGDKFPELVEAVKFLTGKEPPKEEDYDLSTEEGEMKFIDDFRDFFEEAKQRGLMIPVIRELTNWHKKYAEPRIAARKVEVHGKLSEAA